MGVVALLSMLVCALFVPYAQSLVCYDNVAAKEPVFIDCSFSGGSCAVTNRTTTKTLLGIPYVENELLYHCAHKERSCFTGPMNYCNEAKLTTVKKVDCNTWCCEKNKCNVPEKANITVTTVSRRKALPCYQIVGSKQERVKCMFEDSYCMYTEYGPKYSFLSSQKTSASQLCSTKSQCDEMKASCDLIKTSSSNPYSSFFSKTCWVKCCNTSYCNSLPSRYQYEEEEESEPKKNTETKPDWFNSGTYATPTEAAVDVESDVWEDLLDSNSRDETNVYDFKSYNPSYDSPGTHTRYGGGVSRVAIKLSLKFLIIIIVVVVVIISGGIVAVKRGCKKRRNSEHGNPLDTPRHERYTVGQVGYSEKSRV